MGRVAFPPRGVGPALPGRRIALASAVSLSSSARLPPPPAPRRARGGMPPLVVSHVGPAAAATGLPLAGSYVPTPLAEAETAQLSPPPPLDSRSHPGPSGLGLPIRRLAHCLPTAPPPPRSPPSGAPVSGGAAGDSPGAQNDAFVWSRQSMCLKQMRICSPSITSRGSPASRAATFASWVPATSSPPWPTAIGSTTLEMAGPTALRKGLKRRRCVASSAPLHGGWTAQQHHQR